MASFLDKLKQLNENQLKAVEFIGKPLFVVAGAGTGKTNTLTTKIAYLIKELNVDPNNILGVTFTNKAAKEIRERINEMIYPSQMGSWLYTFHAFCLRILREHAANLNMGYKNDFTVVDDIDSRDLIKEVLNKLNISNSNISTGEAKHFISNHKMEIEKLYDDEKLDIYNLYQEELIKNNLMDFDDLIKNVHTLFSENEKVLKKYQNIFKYVLVDEFQDTDKLQYEIIKLINSKNTFVVGDPDQSIYSFRGARYDNNKLFIDEFNAEVIQLDLNYRSTNNILKLANKLISNNTNRTETNDLKSKLGLGKNPVIERFNNDLSEADYVVSKINSLILKGYKYKDIAVLYRNNALSRVYEHKFMQANIPYVIYGGISFYQRKEVKDILAYLKLVVDNNNDFFFKRVVNRPRRGLGNVTISKLESYSQMNNISMFEAIDLVDLPKRAINGLKEFKKIILNIKNKINELENIKDIINVIYDESNYELELDKDSPEVKQNRIENINELKTVFSLANSNYSGTNLDKIKETLDELALFTDQEKQTDDINTTKLSTVHQVKGLEFKVVFVVGVEEEIFPNHRSIIDKNKLEEERRLFYVAITRAEEKLFISSSQQRNLYGRLSLMYESRFIKEIINFNFEPVKIKEKTNETLNNTNFKVGDVLTHVSFGKGIIVSINKDILTIAFNKEFGIKQIKSTFKGLKKE